MSSLSSLNPRAEVARTAQALSINITGARGISQAFKSNLGPKGTMKLVVNGSGDLLITKDGSVLLSELHITHPTARLIASMCSAQDKMFSDGTTATILLIGELLRQADNYVSDGVHPRHITDGFELAKKKAYEVLDKLKVPIEVERSTLQDVARTSLCTKVHPDLAKQLTDVCVDAVLAVLQPDKDLNLHAVEIIEIYQKTAMDSELIRGLVLDHGTRHPGMPRSAKNAYILNINLSMEYEKTEVNSGFFYKTAEEREQFVLSERKFIDQRVQKIVDLKHKLCPPGSDKGFVVINQKGIDPFGLDMLAKAGIMALRRAKRRNAERLSLACGATALNSVEDLSEDALGYAGLVYEQIVEEEKFTFVTDCKNPLSVTIVMKGPDKHSRRQVKDAIQDGLSAIRNAIVDKSVLPGGGATELAVAAELMKYHREVAGLAQLGIQAFAEALLIIPKTLAENCGYNQQEVMVKLQHAYSQLGKPVGLDIHTGLPIDPLTFGIYDNTGVKHHVIDCSFTLATSLLHVNEIICAGYSKAQGKN